MHSLLKSYLEKNYKRNKKVKGYLNLVSFRQAVVFKTSYSLLQSWTKLLRKLHLWGAFFLNFVADRFFPPPLPLEAVLLGLQKKAGSLSIFRKQL